MEAAEVVITGSTLAGGGFTRYLEAASDAVTVGTTASPFPESRSIATSG